MTNLIVGANTSTYTTNSPAVNDSYFVVIGIGSTNVTSSVAALNIFTSGIVSTWTNVLGGSWAAGANWDGGTIASGSGNTADFSTLILGGSWVATLDGARTIGNLIFGDQGNTYNWTVGTGSGGPLTLAVSSASPTIMAKNGTTTISPVLAGSAGMTKTGAGILSLASEDTYSGLTVISNGVLQLSANPGDDGNGTLGNSAITVYGAGELQFNAGDVSGYGSGNALTLVGGDMRQVSAYSETLGRPINLNNGTITANSGAGIINHSPHLNGDCYNENGDVIATAANSTNYISMPAGTQFSLRGGSFSNAAGSVLIVSGVLDDFATGSFGAQSLVKGGLGSMILNSNNTYTGVTTINGGDLEVDGSIQASATVTVNSGGLLSGTGTMNGDVTVQSGGTLMSGTLASMGTLTIGNGLTFNSGSTNVMRINKAGAALNSDLLQGMASVSYGGTLTVTATGDALAAGDTFKLFDSSSYGGVFATYHLPALTSGLTWDLYQLTVNGTIQVVNSGYIPPPPLTNLTAAVSGGVVSLSWPSDPVGLSLQVQTNSVAVGLSTNWVDVANSAVTNQMFFPINTGNGCVFYRLVRPPIDRYALVTRHNIQWNSSTGTIPLGNGEFCFNADGTGLQTFGGNSMSHWGWHSFPLPSGVTADEIPGTGTFETGRVEGPDNPPAGTGAIETWMTQNPHIMNLGRLQLCNASGTALTTGAISGLVRTMNLWSGVQTSSYQVNGQTVTVETCVHPALDAVVVRIQSPLVASGALQVALDFPYPALPNNSWVGNFSQTSGNTTTMTMNGGSRADFARTLDTTNYDVSLAWSPGGEISAAGNSSPNRFLLSAPGTNCLEFVCAFSNAPISVSLPTVEQSFVDTTNHWVNFWSTGGAVDLSGSADSRWFELERRIVLSEYELAAQDAGSWPESENGLMGIDPWVGQFHMEMLWWHLTHYALWNRWSMLTNALPYQRFIPQAQALAAQLDYAGLKWQKEVGPEGRTAPWIYNQVLLWKQPHPIFFAELDYRLHPTLATLENWSNIVFGTADHMADYPDLNTNTGIYSLAFDVPPSEKALWSDTVFDLAYWRWGLNQAQVWRQRLGLARNPLWDQVRTNLAPMPVLNGVFVDYAGDTTTYTTTAYGHPDPIGVYGMLPPIEGVDPVITHSTVLKLWSAWNWNSNTWGWDFPWMAMAAARTGEPQIAVDALLENSTQNQYDTRGVNNGWYLPGNGGLLYAVAMMAAGWDGSSGWAPGFPNDGSWTVKWEGLNKAP